MPGTVVAAGRSAGLRVDRDPSTGELLLSWSPSCTAIDSDYEVYQGALGNFTSHQSVLCSTGGATSARIQPDAGGRYYLVVPRNAEREGSYGTASSGAERPPAAIACRPQLVGSCP